MYREDAQEDRSVLIAAFAGKLFGLNRADGTVAFTHRLGGHAPPEILIHRQRLFVATSNLKLYAFDYPSGRLIGEAKIPQQIPGRITMLVDGDQLFLASSGEVTCFTLRGDPIWTQPFKGQGLGDVAIGLPGNVRQADYSIRGSGSLG